MVRRFLLNSLLPVLLGTPLVAADPPKPKLPDYEAELNDELAKGIVPEKNACVLIWQAFGPFPEGGRNHMDKAFFQRLGIPEPPDKGNYFIGLGKYMKENLGLDQEEFEGILNQQSWAAARPWAAKDYPFINVWLKDNEKPLAVLIEASRRPQYYNPLVSRKEDQAELGLVSALLPAVQKCREVTSALCSRAMLRLQQGKKAEAWADLMACHRLGRLVGRGGTLIESLVGAAIESVVSQAELVYLEKAGLTSKEALDCLKDLQSLPRMATMADKVDLTERYMFKDCVKLLRLRGPKFLGGLINEKLPGLSEDDNKLLATFDWGPALKNADNWYDRMAAAMRLPTRTQRVAALEQIDAELKGLKKQAEADDSLHLQPGKDEGKAASIKIGNTLISLLLPAVSKVQNAQDRVTQVHANQRVAFAMAAYKLDKGGYPAKLDDLAPKYLPKAPRDLFTGRPLIYHPSKDGYLFYSVGVNGKDDQGRWHDDDPRGDDPRVRMPLPPLKKN